MSLPRIVETEVLDTLAAEDPRAQHSRRDLQRLNWVMASVSTAVRALDHVCAQAAATGAPVRVLELGAGDGTLMLRIARARAQRWPGVVLTLLDRQELVTPATRAAFQGLGWSADVVVADVFDWLDKPNHQRWDVVFANLFIHHFADQSLSRLLAGIAGRSRMFFCCEPQRGPLALLGSHLVGMIGANAVTREDAVASVRAGFCGRELSALWPNKRNWRLREYSAGLFSHCFAATFMGD
jgi:hypothetical protein